ncbi:MAG: WD40 repeat domain-containing protein [Aggregatilineales bacterium]
MRLLLILLVLIVLSLGQVSGQAVQTVPQLEPITLENADSLTEVALLGRGTANALDWHPDGDVLAVGSSTGVWLLDENLELIGDTPIKQYVTKLAWSPDGSQIAVVSNARGRCTIQVWDADFTEFLVNFDSCGGQALWNATGTYLAVFNPVSDEVQLIELSTNEVTVLPGQDGAWSPDGNVLFTRLAHSRTYGDTPTLYSWDVETKEVISELEISEDNQWDEILWAVDDHTITLLCRDYDEQSDYVTYRLCNMDVRTGEVSVLQEVDTYPSGRSTPPNDFARNSDERYLASFVNRSIPGFFDYVLVIGNEGSQLNVGDGFAFDWKPDTDTLTAIVGNGEIRTYNARAREVLAQSQWFTAPINDIDSRPNSDEIASTGFGYEQDTYVWDMNESFVESILSFYAEPAEIVDYTPDGSELIAGGRIDTDIVVNLSIDAYDPDTGERLRNIDAFYDQGASPTTRYWNSTYTEELHLPEGIPPEDPDRFVSYFSWSPDASLVATVEQSAQDGYFFRIRIWDATTGEFINQVTESMNRFVDMVWSPDGRQMALLISRFTGSGSTDRSVRVYSVDSDRNYDSGMSDYVVGTWIEYDGYFGGFEATWNSDGTLLAIILVDEIQIHDINGDGEPLVTLPAYDIVDLVWSSDDRFIAGGSADGTIRVWGVPSGE